MASQTTSAAEAATENFADLLAESFGEGTNIEGSVVRGFVIGMDSEAVIIDVGEGRDIHPRNKQIVANRLVRNALNKDYGMDIPSQSPRYQSMEIKGNKMILTLGHVGQGLYCFDVRNPVGFAICGRRANKNKQTNNE